MSGAPAVHMVCIMPCTCISKNRCRLSSVARPGIKRRTTERERERENQLSSVEPQKAYGLTGQYEAVCCHETELRKLSYL